MISFTSRPFYPRGKNQLYPLDKRLGGPQSRSGHCGEEKNITLPGIEPGRSISQQVAIPTELSRLPVSLVEDHAVLLYSYGQRCLDVHRAWDGVGCLMGN
jgi:hypothetical protein